jgi:hypothetical protein
LLFDEIGDQKWALFILILFTEKCAGRCSQNFWCRRQFCQQYISVIANVAAVITVVSTCKKLLFFQQVCGTLSSRYGIHTDS